MTLFPLQSAEAFHRLYQQMWKRLYLYAFAILKDQEQSEDVVQEVFADLWKRRASLEIESLEGYLVRATRYQVLYLLRKQKVRQTHLDRMELVQLTASADAELEAEELAARVREALEDLPYRCRLVFQMSRFDHKSVDEIAEELNISPQTVKNQITKALAHLRKVLGPELWLLLIVTEKLF